MWWSMPSIVVKCLVHLVVFNVGQQPQEGHCAKILETYYNNNKDRPHIIVANVKIELLKKHDFLRI